MDNIIIEKPYEFVPPHLGRWWPAFIAWASPFYLKRAYGIVSHEVRHGERLQQVIDRGDGVVVIGNHCRECDPLAMGLVTHHIQRPVYCMASWHTFMDTAFQRFVIRRCGAFSVHREGTDHRSLTFAVEAVTSATRPVTIFAEGCLSRSNDFVLPLLEGSALISRMAARKRAKLDPPGRVVALPAAYKYFFLGQLEQEVLPAVRRLEGRLDCTSDEQLPLLDRVRRLGDVMLANKETQYLGAARSGEIHLRIAKLVETLLVPIEKRYELPVGELAGYARVQRLRMTIVPRLLEPNMTAKQERQVREELAAIYDCQSLGTYPPDYLGSDPPVERIIETIERLETDYLGQASIRGPWHLSIEIGEPIEVEPKRARGEPDDLMPRLRAELSRMILDTPRPTTAPKS